jgi:hypothetical protein
MNSNYEDLHTLNVNYQTGNYTFTDFNPPGLLLTDRYFDQGLDTDDDSDYNELQIAVEVNVTKNDTYYFDISLGDPVNKWEYNTSYLDVGLHNVSFSFLMNEHYQKHLNTSFVVEHLSITVDDMGLHQQIHMLTDVYTTRVYYYNEFDPPSLIFTDRYWDYAIDTDLNGLYDYLVIDAEVEVTEADNFYFDGNIKSVTEPTSYYFYTNHAQYLDIGVHNVSFAFSDIQQTQLDCSYLLNQLSVRDETFQLINEISPTYETAFYYYNDFERTEISVANFEDNGYSETGSTPFEFILLSFDITFSQSVVDHTIEVTAETNSLSYEFMQSLYGTFPADTITVDFGIDPSSITESSWQTSFDISVRVYDINMQLIFEAQNIYTTQTYYSQDFIYQSTPTSTTDAPEHTTISDDETTPNPRLTPGYTLVLSLVVVVVLPILKKRGR